MEIAANCCRLCFTKAVRPINIFGDAATSLNVVDALAQFFRDQVTQEDALPKIVCHDCWNQIETFQSFVQRIVTIREDYLRQPLNEFDKEEGELDDFVKSMVQVEMHQENANSKPMASMTNDDSMPNVSQRFEKGLNYEDALKSLKGVVADPLNHACGVCGLQGQTCLCAFQNHLLANNVNNDDKRPFQCNICQKRFKSKGTLHSHKYTHSSGPQKCDQCDKISPNMNALKTHVRSVHCESNYKCHICEKTFKLHTALRDHISMHMGTKNYKCSFCDETFIWRMNMYAHRKAMHKEEWMIEKARNKAKLLKP